MAARLRSPIGAVIAGCLLAGACASPAGSPGAPPAPQASPVPSATTMPTATPMPILGGTPSVILEPPEFVTSPTPTRISLPLPQEKLILEAPGPGSQVVSPVRVTGWGGPSSQGKVFVRLIGEQGQVLARTTTFILAPEGAAGQFLVTVPFALSGVAEAGLVEVSINSPTSGRLEHVATRPVVFLSVGPDRIHTNSTTAEKVAIFSPRPDQVVRGGTIAIRGGAWLDEDLPLLIEVFNRAGERIASAEVTVQAPALGELGTFETQLTYNVPYSQYGVVAVTERGLHPPSVRHYTSVRVYLER
jgi:hypothetical protein